MLTRFFLLLGFCLFPLATSSTTPAHAGVIPLKILAHRLNAEIAHTPAMREQGLMHRLELSANSGMLFIFPEPRIYGMWMLNTSIPLSVAFLDEKGIILNIADMTPFTTSAHYSIKPAKYALEMNLGWFTKRNIKAGDPVEGLEYAPTAE